MISHLILQEPPKQQQPGRYRRTAPQDSADHIIYDYTSSYSATFSASIGGTSILPIDICNNQILLLTSSYLGRGHNDGTTYCNITQSLRIYTFNDAGEINKFSWFDSFITGNKGGGGVSLEMRDDIFVSQQLIRISNLSLFNHYSPTYTRLIFTTFKWICWLWFIIILYRSICKYKYFS